MSVRLYSNPLYQGNSVLLTDTNNDISGYDVLWTGTIYGPWIQGDRSSTAVLYSGSEWIFSIHDGYWLKMVMVALSGTGQIEDNPGNGRYFPYSQVADPTDASEVAAAWDGGNLAPTGVYLVMDLSGPAPSVDLIDSVQATLYSQPNQQGPHLTLLSDAADLLQQGWNAPVRSVRLDALDPSLDCYASLYNTAKNGSVSIYVQNPGWVGSGFVYLRSGTYYVVTAAHVILNSTRQDPVLGPIYVALPTAEGVQAMACTVVGVGGTADVGVLALPAGAAAPQQALSFASSCPPAGSCCCVLGDPLGIDAISISQGVVRDNQYVYNNSIPCSTIRSVSVTCPVYGGNSGSPIVDSTGQVIGLVSYGSGEVFSWGVAAPDFQTIVDAIIDQQANFVGKELAGTLVMLDMWVRANYSVQTDSLSGIYVVSSATSGLQAGDLIRQIEGQPVGLYPQYGHATPMLLYMHGSSTISVRLEGQSADTDLPLVDISASEDIPLFTSGEVTERGVTFRRLLRPAAASSAVDGPRW